MQFTIATIAAFAASYVAASPCSVPMDTTIATGNVFHVMSIRSGSDIQYSSLQAYENGLYLNKDDQDSTCDGAGNENVNYASFYLSSEGGLYLNTPGNPPQQVYVDRSTEGQGSIGYTTGAQPIGAHQERGPFSVVDGNLVFVCGGESPYSGFLACPNAVGGGYSVHLDTGLTTPAGLTGCVGFVAKALKEDNPIQCLYTDAPVADASGSDSAASGSYSAASGSYSAASGSYSAASGSYSAASGSYSAAPVAYSAAPVADDSASYAAAPVADAPAAYSAAPVADPATGSGYGY
ncbi:hypothetical protein P153DRAFT_366536 [Dothidotthia symphoricarpi CBS 119687]|uniref:Cell wall protein PhiA n=1 Tax=Dothidotthia symphoricarpi CBS 119687 TaxID=1392245 RepID=A0A6A6AE35_9PLEO|nr:uncharacterized protein P153DRAFT_366536 [Dothidotthia symphoricarpi CBS 119687]KAF2130060.1 hypothetical protein P153DRAFT_366536 [Dothidotthia symphoricarpi CBS 119687]